MADNPLEVKAREVLADSMNEPGEKYHPVFATLVREGSLGGIAIDADTAVAAMLAFAREVATPDQMAGVDGEVTQGLRDAISAGLADWCASTPDIDLSPSLRRDAAEFVLARSDFWRTRTPAAVAAERERCARIAERLYPAARIAHDIAAAIRQEPHP
jgi:hypothetical protein